MNELPQFRYWVAPSKNHGGFFLTTQQSRFQFFQGNLKIQGIQKTEPKYLQRYTGRQDREGNSLWEGDIIFFPYREIYLGEIVWVEKNGSFDILSLETSKSLPQMIEYAHHAQLLGHIHQYPNLNRQPTQ